METPKIKLSDLHKRFDEKVVLNGLDLEIEAGESLVVIGGSGTGKSVMLKCILGLQTPEQGDIRIDGQSVIGISSSEREKVNAKIGMLFQNAALFDRSEEHTSELQSLMPISYAVFRLKQKNKSRTHN